MNGIMNTSLDAFISSVGLQNGPFLRRLNCLLQFQSESIVEDIP